MKMVTVDRRLHGSATGPLWLQSVAPSDTSQSLPSLLLHGTEIFAILALRLLPPLRSFSESGDAAATHGASVANMVF